jgi:hypothetical protein
MQRLFVTVSLAGMLMLLPSDVNAQRAFSSKELTARINALRSRLQDHQSRSVRKVIDRAPLNEDSVEVKVEKAFVELDTSKDAAVTVLFHDSEFPAKEIKAGEGLQTQLAANPALASSQEQKLREEKFAALKLKVQMATRRTHDAAQKINGMVAKIQ